MLAEGITRTGVTGVSPIKCKEEDTMFVDLSGFRNLVTGRNPTDQSLQHSS